MDSGALGARKLGTKNMRKYNLKIMIVNPTEKRNCSRSQGVCGGWWKFLKPEEKTKNKIKQLSEVIGKIIEKELSKHSLDLIYCN